MELPPLPCNATAMHKLACPKYITIKDVITWGKCEISPGIPTEDDIYQHPSLLPESANEIDQSLHIQNMQKLNNLLNGADLLEPRNVIVDEPTQISRRPQLPPRQHRIVHSIDIVDDQEMSTFAQRGVGIVEEEPLGIALEMDDVVRGLRVPTPTTTLEQFVKCLLHLPSEDGKRTLVLSPIQQLRACFIWVSENIRWERMRTLSKLVLLGDETTEELVDDTRIRAIKVMHSRIAQTSDDFVCLLMEFCRLLGYTLGKDMHRVTGYWRSLWDFVRLDCVPENLQPNHSWLMVKVAGEWRMLDPALASPSHAVNGVRQRPMDTTQPMERMVSVGSVVPIKIEGALRPAQPSLKSVKLPAREPCDLFFFLLRPTRAICTHFPTDYTLQFVEPAIDLHRFWEMPYIRPGFFEMCLDLMGKRTKDLKVSNDETLTFSLRANDPDVLVTAEFQLFEGRMGALDQAKERMRIDAFKSVMDGTPPRTVLVQSRFDESGWKVMDVNLRLVGGLTGALPLQYGVLKLFAGMRGEFDQTSLGDMQLACAFRIEHLSSHPVSLATLKKSQPPPWEFVQLFPLAIPAGKSDLYVLEPLGKTLRVGAMHTFRVVPCWKNVKQHYQSEALEMGKSRLLKDLISTSFEALPRYAIGASTDLNRQVYLLTPKKKKHLLIWNHQTGFYELTFQIKNHGMHILALKIAKSDLVPEDEGDSDSGTDTDEEDAAGGIKRTGSAGSLLSLVKGSRNRKVAFAAYQAV
jgi:hypothetical protein